MKDWILIAMEDQGEYGLDGIEDAGVRSKMEEKARLSEIIEILNDRFGMNPGRQSSDFFSCFGAW